MAEKFILTQEYRGYVSKPEPTNIDSRYIVKGSKNVLVNVDGSIGSRNGSSKIATTIPSETTPADTEIDWSTSRGDYFTLKRYGSKLDAIYIDADGNLQIERLHSALTIGASKGEFTLIYDKTRVIDKVVLATGTNKLWMWTGAFAQISAATASTITVASGTWGEKGFPASGNIVIDGVTYAYTGGFDTDTLTGVTPDPSAKVGFNAFEPVIEQTLTGVDAAYKIDYLSAYRNQLYIGSESSRLVQVSSGIDYLNFTLTVQRAAGDPNEFIMDDNSKGFMPTKQSMLMFGANNIVLEVRYALSADQSKEAFTVDHVINGDNQGSISSRARLSVGGNIYYINRDLQMAVIQISSTLSQTNDDINPSELIQNDFDSFDWTDSQMEYWQRNIVVVVPKENLMMLFDLDQKLWQAPQMFQNIDIGSVSITKDNRLLCHSYSTNDTFIIFDENTNNDIDTAVPSKAVFAYNQFGDRTSNKSFNLYYQDGYISPAGKLKRVILYDYNGASGISDLTFNGTESGFIADVQDLGGIGADPVGSKPLGGGGGGVAVPEKRFRYADPLVRFDFYEMQVSYEMEELEAGWRVVAHGPNVNKQRNSGNELIRVV